MERTKKEKDQIAHVAADLLTANWAGPSYQLFHGALLAITEGKHPGTHVSVAERVKQLKRWIGLLRMFARVCENVAKHYEDIVLPEQEAMLVTPEELRDCFS